MGKRISGQANKEAQELRTPYTVLLTDKQTKAGSILLLALWCLCILSTFAVILGYNVRSKISLIRRLEERDKCFFYALAGVKRASAYLKAEPLKDIYTLVDSYADMSGIFKDVSVDDGNFSIVAPYSTGVRYGFIDEESRININSVDMTVLKRLFKYVLDMDEMPAQDLAACVIDWRDSDSELSIPVGSAEDRYYSGLDSPYEAKDDNFEMPDELLLVKGMTPEYFSKLGGYITVYGAGIVNANTASKAVLIALGLNEKLADAIISFRAGGDALPGTGDDNVFSSSSGIAAAVSKYYRLGESETAQINSVAERYLGVNSAFFRAESIASLRNRSNATHVVCVLSRRGRIIYWREL